MLDWLRRNPAGAQSSSKPSAPTWTRIVDYRAEHLDQLLNLLFETAASSGFGLSREKFKHDIIKHIDFRDDIIRLLEDDSGRVIGCYRCAPWPRRSPNTEAAYLFDVAVERTYRRCGYGRKLFDDMFHVLRRDGIREVYSRSSQQNEAGAALHHSAGFEIAKESALWTEWVKLL
ncbi:MAG: GNAT family N-acetyltransferase [Spirochaetes bacterium]|jgi:ribosomal protein S18 acetylase RimI-like enzyme|nr:GNAT family N-acetyltransferase [Spirochaetota bacterium]